MNLKESVKQHWEDETCGTRYGESADRAAWMQETAEARYRLAPYIPSFANFKEARGKKVLEIGCGAGVDFLQWVKNGANATGVDLTEAGVAITRERLALENIPPESYKLLTADAENLPFPDDTFDIVYSWGVLHHTPDTSRAFGEAFRVLKPGGTLRAMIYHTPSMTGLMLWGNALLHGRPHRSLRCAIFNNLESPGTKAYTTAEARKMLEKIGFANIRTETRLCAGDLLQIKPSAKYQGALYRMLWKMYPRGLVHLFGNRFGLELLIEAKKQLHD